MLNKGMTCRGSWKNGWWHFQILWCHFVRMSTGSIKKSLGSFAETHWWYLAENWCWIRAWLVGVCGKMADGIFKSCGGILDGWLKAPLKKVWKHFKNILVVICWNLVARNNMISRGSWNNGWWHFQILWWHLVRMSRDIIKKSGIICRNTLMSFGWKLILNVGMTCSGLWKKWLMAFSNLVLAFCQDV